MADCDMWDSIKPTICLNITYKKAELPFKSSSSSAVCFIPSVIYELLPCRFLYVSYLLNLGGESAAPAPQTYCSSCQCDGLSCSWNKTKWDTMAHSLNYLPPSPVPSATTPHVLLMQAETLAPVSRRQLQPLKDYLYWAPVAAGRSQQEEGDVLRREVTASTAFALRGLFPLLEMEKTLKR